MNALESPLEALAFNYLNYGVLTAVNNIWTVVALLTAAVSFWRIRSSVSPKSDPLRRIRDASPKYSPPPETAAFEPASSAQAECLTAARVPSYCAAESTDGTTSGKFTVYYNENNMGESEAEDCDGEHGDGDDDGYCYGRECWWESVLRVKSGDVGWYRYQDLTVLDGNVVRFWDGCRQRNEISAFQVELCGRICS